MKKFKRHLIDDLGVQARATAVPTCARLARAAAATQVGYTRVPFAAPSLPPSLPPSLRRWRSARDAAFIYFYFWCWFVSFQRRGAFSFLLSLVLVLVLFLFVFVFVFWCSVCFLKGGGGSVAQTRASCTLTTANRAASRVTVGSASWTAPAPALLCR